MERLEERGVVDEENLGERGAALQADLLARVEALRLVDLPERPPETGTALDHDLEPRRRQANRRRPARGGAAVQIVA